MVGKWFSAVQMAAPITRSGSVTAERMALMPSAAASRFSQSFSAETKACHSPARYRCGTAEVRVTLARARWTIVGTNVENSIAPSHR